MPIRPALAALAAAGLVLATTAPAYAGRNPETDQHAGPGQDAGHMLGYPSPTYSWHGCTKTSSQVTPADQDEEYGVPAQPTRGNKQRAVRWTVTGTSSAWQVRWQVADGWRICGVQAGVLGTDPQQTFDLALQAGWTSKRSGGSARSGPQTIRVKVTKQDLKEQGQDTTYAGNYAISKIYSLTVFVEKAG